MNPGTFAAMEAAARALGLGPYCGYMAYAISMLVRYPALAQQSYNRKEELTLPVQEKCLSLRLAVQHLPLAVMVQEGCSRISLLKVVSQHLTRAENCAADLLRLVPCVVVQREAKSATIALRAALALQCRSPRLLVVARALGDILFL